MTAPRVVLTRSRWSLLLPIAACGFLDAGLVPALLDGVRGGVTVDGEPVSTGTAVLVLLLVGLLALLLGVGLVALVRRLVAPPAALVVEPGEVRREAAGRVDLRITREQATGLVYRPALSTTWKRSTPGDPAVRGVSSRRLHGRLEVRAPQGILEISDERRWADVVDMLREWARARPELVGDDVTGQLLLPTGPTAGESAAGTTGAHLRADPPRTSWGLVWRALRTRDPWSPFLPDGYGRYSRVLSGRMSSGRAAVRGRVIWLLPRWMLLLCLCAGWLIVPGFLVWGTVNLTHI
ncbi:hypothetical protein [Nocardioides panaciterrulae]|uniref:Uncharacterized protein n=1 Tax=Nocardioides panaciterrulae TaxID=661492 RepID=A0A7Y9JA53_9ACTN|nr:hypothetical protein [Nocardioides panaciterrulae]NYD41033.1 hypothetical protein [Nocardioides panaciterrulae]